jgi:hypothetical protein
MDTLAAAGAPVEDKTRFRENASIALNNGGVEDTEEVSFAVMNGRWHYLQEVAFDPGNAAQSRREAHHAALIIDNASLSD